MFVKKHEPSTFKRKETPQEYRLRHKNLQIQRENDYEMWKFDNNIQ